MFKDTKDSTEFIQKIQTNYQFLSSSLSISLLGTKVERSLFNLFKSESRIKQSCIEKSL